ncbi:hypothetical protein [Nocardia carnea]|uniref:hypothetical protein n=1 Tax=Nocardia carnea TaxID=37328 RepID=UPI00245446B9|nr:hypothetical protein [Nocardia carnea]
MNTRPIIDAGPALNFIAAHQENILLKALGPLSTPQTVADEVLRLSRTDPLFRGVELRWKTLTRKHIEVLADEGDELDSLCARITRQPLNQRKRTGKDLGELMVLLHAVAAAERGADIIVLIDDGQGARQAEIEIQRLNRMRRNNPKLGSVTLINTVTVLESKAGTDLIPTKADMRQVYAKISRYDDGLPNDISRTGLLHPSVWC